MFPFSPTKPSESQPGRSVSALMHTFTHAGQEQCIHLNRLQVGDHTNQVPARGRDDKHNKAADSSPSVL